MIADHGTLRPAALRTSTSGDSASLRCTTTLGTPNAKCIASAIIRRGSESETHRPRTRTLRRGSIARPNACGRGKSTRLGGGRQRDWPAETALIVMASTSALAERGHSAVTVTERPYLNQLEPQNGG